MHKEMESDFAAEWAQELINDKQWKAVHTFSRVAHEPPNTENSFIASTLRTGNGVRAIRSFHAPGPDPKSAVGHESRQLWSLGDASK